MNCFIRRESCIFLEDRGSVELTKKFFSGKILFLKKQYKLAFDSIQRNESIVPEFTLSSSFAFDFGYKILSIFYHLSNVSEIEWAFLNEFVSDFDSKFYIIGDLKKNVKFLKTDSIWKNSVSFLLRILKLGIIDNQTLVNMCLLRNAGDRLGIGVVSDFSYYLSKQQSVVSEELKISQEYEDNLMKFIGTSISLQNITPISWQFLNSVKKEGKVRKIANVFVSGHYSYDQIRKGHELNHFSNEVQITFLKTIENLKSLEDFYLVSEEFKLFDKAISNDLFKHVFFFFLSQRSVIFDRHNPKHLNRNVSDRFISAIKFLDLLVFICNLKYSINFSEEETIRKNFLNFCAIELSVLLDSESINELSIVNSSILIEIFRMVKFITNSQVYKEVYEFYLSKYFELFGRLR